MSDVFLDGMTWLTEQLKEHASQGVVYQRGISQVTVQATIGRTLLKLDDGFGGVRMEWTDRDFLIPTQDLVLDGNPVLPERGDLIREPKETKVWIYEVMAPGKEPPWRWSDPHRQILRIHTKQIGQEEI